MEKKKIAILGSTGSIGTQSLDVIRQNPDRFEVSAITAKSNWQLLAKQAKEFHPKYVVIADDEYYDKLQEELKDLPIYVASGLKTIEEIAGSCDADIVVTAMVGYSGLLPTISAIKAGKEIALSNKETLVVGGSIIMPLAKKYNSAIVPVDSEHSAIFQCLIGEKRKELRKIFLTASGGPFRKLTKQQLENVTVKDALAHPNWNMGAKVTIDSASMMNKGFEMIEAKWLFNCEPNEIEVVVHPQSIVHSMVEFCDGSVKAQLAVPDMRIPIRYALGFPERIVAKEGFLNISDFATLTFERPDYEKFPLLRLAFDAIEMGGNEPCILNAANEKAVESFLKGKIKFTDMPELVTDVMSKSNYISSPTLEDLVNSNEEALKLAETWIENKI